MESLVLLASIILLVMLVLSLASLVLCLLARLGKVPRVVGYVALGFQAVETLFAYFMLDRVGNAVLVVLVGCLLLTFLPSNRTR